MHRREIKSESSSNEVIEIFDKNGIYKNSYITYNIPKSSCKIIIQNSNKKAISKSFELYNASHMLRKVHKNFLKCVSRVISIDVRKHTKETLGLSGFLMDMFENIKDISNIAIYPGTELVNGKYTIQLMNNCAEIIGYTHIPKFESSKYYIKNEKDNLEFIKSLNLKSAVVPEILFFDEKNVILVQSTVRKIKNSKNKLSKIHLSFCNELYEKTYTYLKFIDSKTYKHITYLINNTSINFYRLHELLNDVLNILNQFFEDRDIIYCFSHDDFYINNIKFFRDKLYVYDWETSKYNTIYYDLFYYIQEPLLRKKNISSSEIVDRILKNKYIDKFEKNNNIDKKYRIIMLIIFLVENIYRAKYEFKYEYSDEIISKNIEMLIYSLRKINFGEEK